MKNNGAEIMLMAMKKIGVDTLFGYPGGAVIPLYDALHRMGGFNHIRTAHEQGAVHAADGYARATGKVGVSIVTSGPGATNTITGIATAFMDSVPMVVITGQVPSGLLGRDAFQEIDITGITFQITKHNMIVKSIDELEQAVYDAFHIATSGRPGPVLIDVPKDIFIKEHIFHDLSLFDRVDFDEVSRDKIHHIADVIKSAKRPIIYAGGGVKIADASKELYELATKCNIPVSNTLMGLGTFPRNHDLSLGLVGMHGFPETNMAMSNSDLIIAIGARFSDRVTGNTKTFSQKSRVIHIDVDRTEFSKNISADFTLLGHVKDTLTKLVRALDPQEHKAWVEEVESYRNRPKEKTVFNAASILKKVNTFFPETVVTTDVGQHQMWTAQYWRFMKPRSFITSGGLGTMGFGLGAAIGVSLAGEPSLLITGDGSFRMNCNELATVATYNLPITIVLMNNNALGMVRQWQDMFQEARYAETCIDEKLDYVKLAEAYGLEGVKVENLDALDAVLKSHTKQKPLLIECKIDKDEKVLPIVPPGQSISNFVLG